VEAPGAVVNSSDIPNPFSTNLCLLSSVFYRILFSFLFLTILFSMDNSEYMRNSDYTPTRLEAQQDAAGVISNSKINSNPENTVGVLSMAGKGVELLVSPTEDSGKVLACLGEIKAEGAINFSSAVQIAQLALKHRKNKNGGQRIIVFVGSPVTEELAALQKTGKLLKKNNVAVNVVSMGELESNNEKLTEFVNAVNSNDNSSFVVVPPGMTPQDAIMSSPIMEGAVGVGGGAGTGMPGGGGGGGGDDFGIDESMDPELAMAMRISMEEHRAAAASSSSSSEGGESNADSAGAAASSSSSSSSEGGAAGEFGGASAAGEEDEDALMQQALALSMQGMTTSSPNAGGAAADVSGSFVGMGGGDDDEEEDEEALMQQALAMSMASGAQPPAAPASGDAGATAGGGAQPPSFLNPDFVKQLFGENDVDLNDPIIQAALAQLEAETKDKEGGDKDSKKRKEGDK
jgi:26S proteasome regulatory subunit N10